MQFNGTAWVSADRAWIWDGYRWRSARRGPGRALGIVLISVFLVCALPVVGYASLVIYLNVATDRQPMASIGGCPSTAFPLPPGNTVDDVGGLNGGWPPRDLGCWTANSETGSEKGAFDYYMDPSHTPGWTLVYAYPETRNARFRSVTHPDLYADVGVGGPPLLGHTKTRLDLTVCFCNPDMFVG